MISVLNIPFLNSLKFVPSTATPGYPHFDADWAFNQIKVFETKAKYYQKWQVGDSTIIQIESSIIPDPLKIYNCKELVKIISFVKVADAPDLGVSVYEAPFNIDDLDVYGVYYAYIHVQYMSIEFASISEPIRLQTLWENTMLFTYRNSVNNWGVAFTTGIQFGFRCEAGIMDYQPESDTIDYIDQIHNVEILSGTPFRTFKLYVGDERGVSPWVLDLLNWILVCDNVEIEGLQYTKNAGAKWEINRIKPWPLYGGSIEITPSKNISGLQFVNTTDPDGPDGMVFAYDIDTNFFGTAKDDNHILENEQTD